MIQNTLKHDTRLTINKDTFNRILKAYKITY